MPRIKLSSKLMMGVVTCVVKSDMFVDRLRIVSVFLLSFRMPYRKRDQISRSYSLSWMWIQNHVQEKNKKKYPFLNKHQTFQDMTCQYKAELKLQSRTLNLGHTAPGTYFSLFQSCFVMFFWWNCPIRGQHWKGGGKDVKDNMSTSFLQLTQVLSSWF